MNSKHFQSVIIKTVALIFILAISIFSVWYFADFREEHTASYVSTVPRFANASVASDSSSYADSEQPDYEQYSDLVVPPLSPKKALDSFKLPDGFHIETVAHEPQVINPVSMDVDAKGRLWIVEMKSYMPVIDKSEKETSKMERVPKSRIVVLEDTTGDGTMDDRWVFMDNLVLPRSIKVLDDGVLIAEPPNLFFIQDTTGDGVGDTKERVYDEYGDVESYNIEHMANGLLWGMDNWIYSVYSDVSFRRINGQWHKRPFEPLTQWGITQDSRGRLYSTSNSRLLTSHLVPHSYSHRHPEYNLEKGINVSIAERETVWPAHPTGVNRGYKVGDVVRKNGTLKRATSACGPIIYRGQQFGKQYRANAFVPEPAGNLIKRLVGINSNAGKIQATAKFAYEGKEFLTSTDERFRPVNLHNAPDGSIYVVDMYQGVIQHAIYLTDFLKKYIREHDLDKPGGYGKFGRIYRIVRDDKPINYDTADLSTASPAELVNFLYSSNGLIRDQAQQLLVQRSAREAIPSLEQAVQDTTVKYYTRLQALWTLEGFDQAIYSRNKLFSLARFALNDAHPNIRASAVKILEPALRNGNKIVLKKLLARAEKEQTPYAKLQLLASLGESSDPSALKMMAGLFNEEADNRYFQEMALNGVYKREDKFLQILRNGYNWQKDQNKQKDEIISKLQKMIKDSTGIADDLSKEELQLYQLGKKKFNSCMGCHGNYGQGIDGVAPALNGSKWVNKSDPGPLIHILQNGYIGSPESRTQYSGAMPSHKTMSNTEVAAVLTYIRNAWKNKAPVVTAEEVKKVRKIIPQEHGPWTEKELLNLNN